MLIRMSSNVVKYNCRIPHVTSELLQDTPSYQLSMDFDKETLRSMDVPNRCSVIVFGDLLIQDIPSNLISNITKLYYIILISTSVAVSIVKKISKVLEQVPKFALIISNKSANKSAAFPSSLHSETIPWILTSAGSHVVTAGRCGNACNVVSRVVTCHRSRVPSLSLQRWRGEGESP